MSHSNFSQTVAAVGVQEGAGVIVHRTIGTRELRNLDPFLMLDHFGSDDPNQYIAGFPDHPHRGFITFTYMLDGHMLHRDSMGNSGDLHPGSVQWMKAASGVIHSEMPKQTDGLMRGFQLWINLPAAQKMSDPEYREYPAEQVPEVQLQHGVVRVLAGEYASVRAPIQDENTLVRYLDVRLNPGATWVDEIAAGHRAFMYLYEGQVTVNGERLETHNLAVLDVDQIEISASGDAKFILVSGRPIGEPIVQYGPFVMNTEDEIRTALSDFQRGVLVKKTAEFVAASN